MRSGRRLTRTIHVLVALAVLGVGIAGCSPVEPDVRVLFLGNSHTHTNDLPATFVALAASVGVTVEAESHAPGGWWLQDHTSSDETLALLGEGGWDYVILQEQSMAPAVRDLARREMYPAAVALSNRAAGARVVLFETWGHRSGSTEIGLDSYDAMQSAVTATYRELAGALAAEVAPVGTVWASVREQHPEVSLYQPDGYHPSTEGTYLAAVVMAAAILDIDAVDVATVNLPDGAARALRSTAADVLTG